MGHLLLKGALLGLTSNPSWNSVTWASSLPVASLGFPNCNGECWMQWYRRWGVALRLGGTRRGWGSTLGSRRCWLWGIEPLTWQEGRLSVLCSYI